MADRLMRNTFGSKMNIGRPVNQPCRAAAQAAFTLVELIVAMAIIGTVVVALFGSLSSAFASTRLARENLRATQILVEKTEAIRLYTWDQINDVTFIPRTFSVPYDPAATNGAGGVVYTGRVTIAPVALGASYASEMRLITVQVNWTTGSLPRQRTLSTYMCRSGLQNYFY